MKIRDSDSSVAAAASRTSAGPIVFPMHAGPKRLGVALLLLLALSSGWYLHHRGLLAPDGLLRFANDRPVLAVMVFVAVYAVAVLSVLPTLPLNLAAGLFWGTLLGGIISTAGASAGAVAAFVAARSLLGRPLARRCEGRFLRWLQSEFDTKGWRFVAFLRLNPIFPTGPLNYVLGLTSIRARTYVWSTVVFLLPPSLAIAMVGREMQTFMVQGAAAGAVRTLLGVSAGVALLFGIRYAARFLNYARSNAS